MVQKIVVVVSLVAFAFSISIAQEIDGNYQADLDKWRQKLAEGRKGYLALTGLFKLKDHKTTFGSDAKGDYVLSIDGIPSSLGTYVNGKELQFIPAKGVDIETKSGEKWNKGVVHLDNYGSSEKLYFGRLSWCIITRGGELYIRAWDKENPAIDAFQNYVSYSTSSDFISTGQFKYFDSARSEEVHSRLGVIENTDFIGTVSFTMQGSKCTLDVGRGGFTMVRDETSGDVTYGGGRYIYLDLPTKDSAVVVDFNRLYNPPCAFSEFTTCLLPPKQNTIAFPIEAGETLAKLEE